MDSIDRKIHYLRILLHNMKGKVKQVSDSNQDKGSMEGDVKTVEMILADYEEEMK